MANEYIHKDRMDNFSLWNDILRNYFLTYAFLAISMSGSQSYMTFTITDEEINTCCIVFMMYLVVFLITLCLMQREEYQG